MLDEKAKPYALHYSFDQPAFGGTAVHNSIVCHTGMKTHGFSRPAAPPPTFL